MFDATRADSPESDLVSDLAALWLLLEAAARIDAPLAVYATDQSLLDLFSTWTKHSNYSAPVAFAKSRPPVSESAGIASLLELAKASGTRLLVRQITTAAAAACVQRARSSGDIDLWAEVNPHHLFLSDSDVQRLGWRGKVIPPLRAESDVLALWAGLSNGTLDLIATDHAPHLASERTEGDFWSIPAGLPALETTLPLCLDAVAAGKMSFANIVQWLSRVPAQFLRLYPKKGTLLPGADADFVLVDPKCRWTISDDRLLTRAGWTPFVNREVQGRVVATFVRGQAVYQEGEIKVRSGYGHFLHPISRPSV